MPSKKIPAAPLPPAPAQSRTLDEVIGYQLARASVRTNASFFEVAGVPLELRPVEYTILALIQEIDGISPARLAELLAVSPPNVTVWIAKLEKRGLVARSANQTDRRAQMLSLTATGAKITTEATTRIVDAEQALFKHLTAGERLLLRELLNKLAESPAS